MPRSLLILPLLLLAGCGDHDRDKGQHAQTEIAINADGDDGVVQVRSGKDGSRVSINGDDVKMNFKLPDFARIDIGDDFDIDGVKLYPGSHVTSVNIDASDKDGADKATVKIGFTSPAAPAKAADWMADAFGKKDIVVTRNGDTLTGKTADGDDFTIRLSPAGDAARGEAVIVSH